MLDITKEPPIRLTEAARLVGYGRNDRPTHISTVLRWIIDGAKTPSGERVHLEAIRVGRAWKTTAAAVQRFLAALTPTTGPTPTRTPSARKRDSERARRKLEKMGAA